MKLMAIVLLGLALGSPAHAATLITGAQIRALQKAIPQGTGKDASGKCIVTASLTGEELRVRIFSYSGAVAFTVAFESKQEIAPDFAISAEKIDVRDTGGLGVRVDTEGSRKTVRLLLDDQGSELLCAF